MHETDECCQSCALPFDEGHRELRAQELDATDSPYCVYCYQDGHFVAPDATVAEMVEIGVPHLASKIGEAAARAQLRALVPTLRRWAS